MFKGRVSTEATELLSVCDSSLFTDSEGGDQTHPAELMFPDICGGSNESSHIRGGNTLRGLAAGWSASLLFAGL